MGKPISFFKSLQILHLGILAGLSLFAIIAVFISEEGLLIASEERNRNLQVIAIIFSLSSLILGFNLFKKSILRIRESSDPSKAKTNQYRMACIIWWVMIEAPGIFAIVGYILTHNLAFFFLGLLHIVILFIFMPRRDNIILLLNLNSEEAPE